MAIAPIKLTPPLGSVAPAGNIGGANPAGNAAQSFGNVLNDAVSNLNQLQSTANGSMTALASGQPVDLQDVMVQSEQANIAFQLTLQVRNKILDAYQEVTRMQI